MISPYFDKKTNCVFLRGALHPINPATNVEWANEQDALDFLSTQPQIFEQKTSHLVITEVSGTDVSFYENVVEVDAAVTVTVNFEIQQDGKTDIEFNRTLRLPVDRDGQQGIKVLKLVLKEGKGQLTTQFETGEYYINEYALNRRLKSENFIFMPEALHILVSEATKAKGLKSLIS